MLLGLAPGPEEFLVSVWERRWRRNASVSAVPGQKQFLGDGGITNGNAIQGSNAMEQGSGWKNQLILDHRLFAQNVARKLWRHCSTTGVDCEDLEGAAMVGLCDAARRFSPDKGSSFRTFAYLRIRGAVYDLLRRQGRVSRQVYRQAHDEQAEYDVAPAKGAEVVESLGIQLHGSGETADVSYLDAWNPEATTSSASTARHIARSVAALSEPERTLIQLHYYQGISFEELRHTFGGASKSWVSRLHLRAIKQLHALVAPELS
jgi:RNA polymerase sigma factor for flagellar operon FliA